MTIHIIQVDNRPCASAERRINTKWIGGDDWKSERDAYLRENKFGLSAYPYWELTRTINEFTAKQQGWTYAYVNPENLGDRAPQWLRIPLVKKMLGDIGDDDLIVYLDTDAYIRDAKALSQLFASFQEDPTKLLMASADPVNYQTTYPIKMHFNTGFLAFKKHPRIVEFLDEIWDSPTVNPDITPFLTTYGFEQSAFNYVYEKSYSDMVKILDVDVCNTPAGKVICHNWWKDQHFYIILFNDLVRVVAEYNSENNSNH